MTSKLSLVRSTSTLHHRCASKPRKTAFLLFTRFRSLPPPPIASKARCRLKSTVQCSNWILQPSFPWGPLFCLPIHGRNALQLRDTSLHHSPASPSLPAQLRALGQEETERLREDVADRFRKATPDAMGGTGGTGTMDFALFCDFLTSLKGDAIGPLARPSLPPFPASSPTPASSSCGLPALLLPRPATPHPSPTPSARQPSGCIAAAARQLPSDDSPLPL